MADPQKRPDAADHDAADRSSQGLLAVAQWMTPLLFLEIMRYLREHSNVRHLSLLH